MKKVDVKIVFSGIIACLVLLMLVFAGSCGKSKASSPSSHVELASMSVKSVLSRRNIPPLEELLAELDALDKPPEVDGELWASLKADMRECLLETFGGGKRVSKYLGDPTSDYVKPRDLKWEKREDDPEEETFGKLVWRYANDGDYEQDGIVYIEDFTPFAMHYGEYVGDEANTILELIDEDDDPEDNGDGMVDAPEHEHGYHNDLETIARNFHIDIAQYEVLGSEDDVNWDHLAYIDFSEGADITDERDKFEYYLEYGNYQVYKVRALSAGPPGEYGEYWWHSDPYDPEGSIVEARIVLGPPVITGVTEPPQGPPDTPITFTATVEGPTPYTSYAWTFGPHADPPQSFEKKPSVTFDEEFIGTGVLAVFGRFGSDVYGFPIEITGEMAPVIDSISPSPAEGDEGDELTFSAEVRGSEPFTYAWDFGGGATPNTSSDESPTVTLGDPGPPYSASLTVVNEFGEATKEFDLAVHGWIFEDVDTGGTVSASLSLTKDQNDDPGIGYQSESKHLMYAWREGGVWYSQVAEGCEEIPSEVQWRAGKNCSLAFNPNPGNPAIPEPSIAYERAKFTWNEEQEKWDDALERSIRFARLVAGNWEASNADTDDSNEYPCLAFDGSIPFISYHKDLGISDLYLIHERPAGTWNRQQIDEGPDQLFSRCGVESSMAVDNMGRKHIAYLAASGAGVNSPYYDLRYALCYGASIPTYVPDRVYWPEKIAGPTSIALNPAGYA